ncbi:MAG: ribosome recycling factor [Planctomycetota bacterium]|nr:ribosome recycling factor [Planctomycetota bacterium]
MSSEEILFEAEESMEKAVDHLRMELRGIRTGRANPGLVENIRVDYYGSPTPLKQIANIGVPEPAMLVVKPFDPGSAGDIEKAILASNIGITPNSDGKVIRLAIPPLSEERRKQLVKLSKDYAEAQRVALRNIRRDANRKVDALKKDGALPEDDAKRDKEEIEELTKKFVKSVDEVLGEKSKELLD